MSDESRGVEEVEDYGEGKACEALKRYQAGCG